MDGNRRYAKDRNIKDIQGHTDGSDNAEYQTQILKFAYKKNEMNDDFIFIEPKLIPIIPGDDPAVISKVSEFNEDYF